jgi:polyisoprenoid-binding protein YceI/rhodanese-related sulfurtransferase
MNEEAVMATVISRQDVAAKIEQGARVVEALPPEYHRDVHLPGAANLPHDRVDELADSVLPDKHAEIIVYCSNTACQNSTQAARRLTELGYTRVFDYEAGKQDWIEAGLPTESGPDPTRRDNDKSKAATRTVDGVEVPAAGVWKVDPGHAEVGFVGRHFMITKVRGRFVDVDATVAIGRDPADSHLEAVIQMASVDSGDQTRDDHLRSSDLFDVDRWPIATFGSTGVTWAGTAGTVVGELTIRDVTRTVTLEVSFLGAVTDPWDNQRAVFEAHGRIDREDWGLTWNMPLDSGGLLVSKQIDLEFHVELIRQ